MLCGKESFLMPPQLFTADDIRRFAREKREVLVLGYEDILTQEAADTAYALGMRVVREVEATGSDLPPLKVVHLANVQVEPFLDGKATPGTNVWWKKVVTSQDHSPMVAGYMSLDKGEAQRTLDHDEIDIVLEGELVIQRGSEQVRGKTGDVIYIPKGSNITFGTPNWTRFAYVAFPANRNEK